MLLSDYVYNGFQQKDNEPAVTYHMVGLRPEAYANTDTTPKDSVFGHKHDIHDEMLFGKRIEPTDVQYMIRNIPWVSGSEYDVYDDQDEDIADKDFYVVADQTDGSYAVFKCLYKARSSTNPKTSIKPNKNQTAADEDVYITGDGYHWKYMYEISAANYTKFATSNYVPYIEDSAVTANAVSGSIDAILIETSGSGYNNYATGTIREGSVGGNSLKFSLEGDEFDRIITYDIKYTDANTSATFSEGDTVTINVPDTANVDVTVYKIGPSSISFEVANTIEDFTQSTVETSNTITLTSVDTVATADVLRIRQENVGKLSSINDYYTDSSIYIRSGPGAGEIKKITDYTVSGNERTITVESAFTTTPTIASTFSIAPTINLAGDGSGAKARPIIDTTANSIVDIEIIDRGSGYTYATANTNGYSGDSYVQASLRPTIPPFGGHGSDIKEELYATQIGISTTFSNTDVRDDVTYNGLAVIKNLLADNVVLTIDSNANNYTVGETLTQTNRKAEAEISALSANTITLTNVLGSFVTNGNTITGSISGANSTVSSINKDTDVFDNTLDLGITLLTGSFTVGENVTQATSGATGYVISANTTVIVVSRVFGTFNTVNNITGDESGATATVNTVTNKNIVDNSGKVIYMENIDEIQRTSNTKETIKLVIKF